jgi:hypothetical protein
VDNEVRAAFAIHVEKVAERESTLAVIDGQRTNLGVGQAGYHIRRQNLRLQRNRWMSLKMKNDGHGSESRKLFLAADWDAVP